jgi:stage V sporulation protein G
MKITDVRIRPIENQEGKIKATASITLDEEFVVHDLKIIDSSKGLFVAMPSKKNSNNEFKDTAHPIKTATRTYIQETVLAKYEEVIGDTE